MTRLSFEVSEEIERAITTRAKEAGFESVSDYLQSIVQADLESEVDPELESLLLKGMASQAKEVTQTDWDARRNQLRKQMGRAS